MLHFGLSTILSKRVQCDKRLKKKEIQFRHKSYAKIVDLSNACPNACRNRAFFEGSPRVKISYVKNEAKLHSSFF